MALPELIEQLAFGSSMPKLSSCIGICLSPDVIFLSEVRVSGGKPVVDHLVRVPIPPAPASKETKTTGILNADALGDTERIAGLLRRAMSQLKWRSEHAVATFSSQLGILRYFTMPAVDPRFLKTAVPAEAKKYIPMSFDELVNDFQTWSLPASPDKRVRLGALIGVAQRRSLESLKALLEKLDLKLVGAELAPCSVGRLWDAIEKESGPYAQVHFDGGMVRILLSENNVPIFVREILIGAQATASERRKVDLPGCIDFVRKQLGAQRPAKVRLSGNAPDMADWKQVFAQEVGLPVVVQDTAKALGVKAGDWGGYASIGAALRHLVPTPLWIDLSQAGRADATDRRVAADLFAAAGMLAAVLFAAGLFQTVALRVKSAQLAELARQGSALPAFQGKTAEAIQAMINDMKARVDSVSAVSTGNVRLTRILEELAEDVPDAVWLTNLSYSNPLTALLAGNAGVQGQGRALVLIGNASGQSESAEQQLVIDFQKGLLNDARFHKIFQGVEVSVKADAGGAAANSGALDDSHRTSFTINCAPGKGNG